ncbi:hypothetical protein COLO4_37423 [Corchorus olitorius]|uniref:Leucine-rich repeat-containing N-terminal plant-type domain-containing protein n=1 Tax=Corchorus olitorius TaxID=93759 RepID=A0A1R3G201_9ROSI|nr:hypothetical protein COLO4_37423 [Corchorus olitorius]
MRKMRCLVWKYQFFFCFFIILSLHFHFHFHAEAAATVSSTLTSTRARKTCSHSEAAALLHFSQSFVINSSASTTCDVNYGIVSYPKTESWKESTDCCSWDGVECDGETGHVIGLDLSCSWLYGTIPSNSTIFLLQHLKTLDLSFNDFRQSRIPAGFGKFASLTLLKLSFSRFAGQIPSDISNLSNLISLDLSSFKPDDSQLKMETTTLKRLAQNFSEVQELFLDGINMSSVDPSHLMNLSSSLTSLTLQNCELRDLDMSDNQLTGPIPIPHHATGLSNLVSLYLSNNFLNETLPSWVLNLPSLHYLYLANNRLTGDIRVFDSKSLTTIDLGSNLLQGQIPSSIFKLANLTLLDLSTNNLSGIVELDMFSELKSLEWLDLSHNNLSLSNNIRVNYTLPNLRSLFLSSCNLTEFPNFLRGSKDLLSLDLSENRIHGQIPEWMWDVGKDTMTYLSLSQNFLTGSIQFPWLNILSLQLHSNMLQGLLPEFNKGCQVKALNFFGNQFQGELPRSLVNCTSLEVLDLGNNNINGTFPYWLETLPELQVLVLRSNKFHGWIPESKASFPFPKLRVLDLSDNNYFGPLPTSYIKNLKAMANANEGNVSGGRYMQGSRSYDYSLTVTMKGLTTQLVRILTIFTSIDLSNNKFEGVIPQVFGKLSSLKGLNLSRNNLNGHIPPSLGNLTKLEWLDLSSNMLVGKIPEELVDLISLSFLNLSNNQLVGSIPQGKQFNTFENNSYQANLGLCGFPLSKGCNETPKSPPSTLGSEEDDSESGFGFGWKVVAMGYGCGFIVGVGAGFLVFRNGKPRWFISLFGLKQHHKVNKSKKQKASTRSGRGN